MKRQAADPYHQAEKLLYGYPRNIEQIDILLMELELVRSGADVKAQSYETRGGNSGNASPVENFYMYIEKLENKIISIQKKITPVRIIKEELTVLTPSEKQAQQLIIMEEYYFWRYPVRIIQRKHGMTRGIFSIRRDEILQTLISRLIENETNLSSVSV